MYIKAPKPKSKDLTKRQIVRFFKVVCKGIRDEYEKGASYRRLDIDVSELRELLGKL
jgi:hypothetical protein